MKWGIWLLGILLLTLLTTTVSAQTSNNTENATEADIELLDIGENSITLRVRGTVVTIPLNSTNKTFTINNITIDITNITIFNISSNVSNDLDSVIFAVNFTDINITKGELPIINSTSNLTQPYRGPIIIIDIETGKVVYNSSKDNSSIEFDEDIEIPEESIWEKIRRWFRELWEKIKRLF